MINVLESTITWAVPCLIATMIVVPAIWNKLRTHRVLETMHQTREHRGK